MVVDESSVLVVVVDLLQGLVGLVDFFLGELDSLWLETPRRLHGFKDFMFGFVILGTFFDSLAVYMKVSDLVVQVLKLDILWSLVNGLGNYFFGPQCVVEYHGFRLLAGHGSSPLQAVLPPQIPSFDFL